MVPDAHMANLQLNCMLMNSSSSDTLPASLGVVGVEGNEIYLDCARSRERDRALAPSPSCSWLFWVPVFIAFMFMAVLGAIAEQVGRFANANVLFSISYTTSSFNLYGAKMFRDSAQHINMLFCAKVKLSFFIPISLVRVLCAWSAVVTAPLLLPSMYT